MPSTTSGECDSEKGKGLAERLNEVVLCRKKEIDTLMKLFYFENEMSPSSVFINGNTATGKSYLVQKFLSLGKFHHSYINCIECFTSKLLYQTILKDVGLDVSKACSTMTDFCRLLKQATLFENNQNKFYIVFDQAERLRTMDQHLLPAFLRLSELTSLNICVVLISGIVFEKFLTTSGLYEPFKVHFSDYTKVELETIMALDCPKEKTKDFYSTYCHIILDVFFSICRDLNELRHLAIINFSKYCEPITNGEIQEHEVRKLWQCIVPHLRKTLQKVYLREVPSSQWEKMQQVKVHSDKPAAQVELPYYSKYLLLAAYFASYNPATTDRRYFAKRTMGKLSNKAKSSIKAAKKVDKKFLGPKVFSIDRLMAIFYSIAEGGASTSSNILSQLSTLITLNLLTKASADDQIDVPKYKCIIPLELAISVGKQVELDVVQYLHDT